MRIAILDKSRCKPKDCNFLCMRVCPRVRTGDETITVSEDSGKPVISESLCSGCGICVKKCPYQTIHIINLPEEIGNPVHQYGTNGFRLYNLPTPKEGAVVGIVGCNGIGKTTALKILAGEITPNLGGYTQDWNQVIDKFKGNEIQNYLKLLSEKKIKAAYKPQYVGTVPQHVKGTVREILERGNENNMLDFFVRGLDLENSLDKDVSSLSGGELQKMVITTCLIKDASIYFLDEPSSYLDVRERLNVAKVVRSIKDKFIFVVEHDLVVLDYLSDYVHVIFGASGAYGIISNIMTTRVGINEYLSGFLKSENMRFREEIKFEVTAPKEKSRMKTLSEYPRLVKKYDSFMLDVKAGRISVPEVLGILGPNATGKTTFVKILAKVERPDNTTLDSKLNVAYKPQYIKPTESVVKNLGVKIELVEKFSLQSMMDRKTTELSGGELQKVAIVECLSKDADMYLLDEPSAYLDVEERLKLGKYLKKFVSDKETTVLVVDHDILLIDYLSDELMVFEGESGRNGKASNPMSLREGMNSFLKGMDVTFRRDPDSGRPRANKPDSVKDREQKKSGEYYYA